MKAATMKAEKNLPYIQGVMIRITPRGARVKYNGITLYAIGRDPLAVAHALLRKLKQEAGVGGPL